MDLVGALDNLSKNGVTVKHEIEFSFSDLLILFAMLFVLAGIFQLAKKVF